jgi:hypothetical protein
LIIQLQWIYMSDIADQYVRNVIHRWVYTLKGTWHLGRQMTYLSVQSKLDSFFKPELLHSKTSENFE